METQRVRQPFMKVSLGNMCSFFCQFCYRLLNTVRFNEEIRKLLYKCVDLIANVFEKSSEISFLEGVEWREDYVSPLWHRVVVNIAWFLGG